MEHIIQEVPFAGFNLNYDSVTGRFKAVRLKSYPVRSPGFSRGAGYEVETEFDAPSLDEFLLLLGFYLTPEQVAEIELLVLKALREIGGLGPTIGGGV